MNTPEPESSLQGISNPRFRIEPLALLGLKKRDPLWSRLISAYKISEFVSQQLSSRVIQEDHIYTGF